MHKLLTGSNINTASTARGAAVIKELRFRRLLNDLEWAKLPNPVKKRFSEKPTLDNTKIYRGRIIHTRMNLLGKLLSKLMLLIGGPLPLDTENTGASAIVTVSAANNVDGQIWTRQYDRKKGSPQLIQSRKQFSGPTGLEEFLGHGLGMTLKLSVTRNSLLFIADKYFLDVFGLRIYLPVILSPGKLTISHTNKSDYSFTFGMTLIHPLFGEVVSQEIFFED